MDEQAEGLVTALRARAARAVEEGDWLVASSLWLDVLRLGAADRVAPVQAGLSLRHARRFAEADAVLLEAAARFVDDVAISLEYAWVAHSAACWDEAERRWRAVRAAHPNDVTAYVCSALSLRVAGRRQTAEAILRSAMERLPEAFEPAVQFAWTAHWAGDLKAAHARWTGLQRCFPDRVEGFAFGAAALRDLGDHDGARALLDDALRRFPGDPQLRIEALLIDVRKRDFTAVLTASAALRDATPQRPEGWRYGARALIALGRLEEAEALLTQGLAALPGHVDLLAEHAATAQAMRDWPTARARWQQLLLRHPGSTEAHEALGQIVLETQLDEAADPARGAAPPVRQEGDLALLLRFESLGDNCEFGLIQRHHGVEPLGLLRWGSIAPESLIQGLEGGFTTPVRSDDVSLTLDDLGEYIAVVGGLFRGHTFYREGQIDPEALRTQLVKRYDLLRRKLLHALAEGSRIFVVKRRGGGLAAAEAHAIAAAIARHGPAQLLWVQVADAAHPPGSAVRLAENLITGYVERLPETPNTIDTPHDTWLVLLRRVAELVDETVAAARPAADGAAPDTA